MARLFPKTEDVFSKNHDAVEDLVGEILWFVCLAISYRLCRSPKCTDFFLGQYFLPLFTLIGRTNFESNIKLLLAVAVALQKSPEQGQYEIKAEREEKETQRKLTRFETNDNDYYGTRCTQLHCAVLSFKSCMFIYNFLLSGSFPGGTAL